MQPKQVINFAIGSLLIYILLVVGTFVWAFHGNPLEVNDPAAWGQFGDYIGGLLNPALAALNVAVIVYLAMEVQQLSEAQRDRKQESAQRVQTAIELHREWNSETLYQSRTSAGKLVRKYPESSYFDIENEVTYEEAYHIWIVVGFFQRLEFLARHDKLDKELVRELFGELFVWWWAVTFSTQLAQCDCDARVQMTRLKDWFYALTTEEQRAPWLERANRDLNFAREQAKLPPFIVLG